MLTMMENKDCMKILPKILEHSFHAIITDPPYGIEWLGKEWDTPDHLWDHRSLDYPSARGSGKDNLNMYRSGKKYYEWFLPIAHEMFRTLKPGGSCMVFSSTMTLHYPMLALENAGFEIRDVLMWNYHTGFPKAISASYLMDRSMGYEIENTSEHAPISEESKKWDGWAVGRMKPAWEPIIWARSPPEGTTIDNMKNNGVGGFRKEGKKFPANVIVVNGDNVSDKYKIMYSVKNYDQAIDIPKPTKEERDMFMEKNDDNSIQGDIWDKKLHCSECGLPVRKPETTCKCGSERLEWKKAKRQKVANIHPTVKPIRLFEHLIRMVTRRGQNVADPFFGSGTSALACKKSGRNFWGTEINKEYYDIAMERVRRAYNTFDPGEW